MRWRGERFSDLERQLRATRATPRRAYADAILRRFEGERPRRTHIRLAAAVALTSVAALALVLTGGTGFAAYGVHQLAKSPHIVRHAKQVKASPNAPVNTANKPGPSGHQYVVLCGANSSSVCVASIGSSQSVQEPKGAKTSRTIKLTISLNAPSDGTARVAYNTADVLGTTAGVDYATLSGQVQFSTGKSSAQIVVTILDDGDASNKTLHGENFKVHISPVAGVTIGAGDANVTITGS